MPQSLAESHTGTLANPLRHAMTAFRGPAGTERYWRRSCGKKEMTFHHLIDSDAHALLWIAYDGYVDSSLLAANGADLNAVTSEKHTPLHSAAYSGSVACWCPVVLTHFG